METVALNPTRLALAAIIGLIILLVLIIKFHVHAMISILVGALSIGLIAGMPVADIINAVNDGIGNTLKGIALLVGLGSMFGAILELSGGATRKPPGRSASPVWSSPSRFSSTRA